MMQQTEKPLTEEEVNMLKAILQNPQQQRSTDTLLSSLFESKQRPKTSSIGTRG